MDGQCFFGFSVGAVQDAFDLFIDFSSGLLAAIALELKRLAREVSGCSLGAVSHSYFFAHSIETDHLASERGSVLEIVLSAGGQIAIFQLFGGTSSQHAPQSCHQFGA